MTDKLLNALRVIKEECKSHGNSCKDCPLLNCEGLCGVNKEAPEDWMLEKREVYF